MYQTKITDVLTSEGNFFYVQDSTTKTTTNFNVHCIFETLEKLRVKGRLPKHLFLVLDSASNNKSETMCIMNAILVRYGSFITVQLMYLPVGHTHWLNDQIFSTISKKFSRSFIGIESPEELTEYLRQCYHPKDQPNLISKVLWIRQVLL